MDLSTLITTLSGGESYREKSGLPEFKDIFPDLIASVKTTLLGQAAAKLLKGEMLV
jgi:hypothetical protein